jgi:hypothetical protein
VKRLLMFAVVAFALFAGHALYPADGIAGKGGSLGTEDSCAASLAPSSASACGGTIYLVYLIAYSPNPTGYSNGQRWCEYHWSNGVVTNSPC